MSEEATPFPPRYRWLKRGLAVGLCALLGLGTLRWWWGREAQRRIDALIADAHARGEPILPEDFPVRPPVPDSENAAVTYLKAAAAIDMGAEPHTLTDFATMRQIEAGNTTAIALAHTARSQRRVNWGSRNGPFGPPAYFFPLNHLRQLANVLAYSARGELAAGHDVKAIELLRDIVAEARALDAHPTGITANMVGTGVGSLGNDCAIRFSPALGNAVNGVARLEVTASMRGLIGDLLDEDGLRSSLREGYNEQAKDLLVVVQSPACATGWVPAPYALRPVSWALQPMFELYGSDAASVIQIAGRSTASPNFAVASAVLRGLPPRQHGRVSTLEGFACGTQFRIDDFFNPLSSSFNFTFSGDRRAAAIMLALRLYQLDHADGLPERLSALVPRYLSALPADPMRANGGTFGYLPHANPPILYSVGLNGNDDGGSSAVMPGMRPGYRWRCQDAVFQLTPAPPPTATAPSTQAQNNN